MCCIFLGIVFAYACTEFESFTVLGIKVLPCMLESSYRTVLQQKTNSENVRALRIVSQPGVGGK